MIASRTEAEEIRSKAHCDIFRRYVTQKCFEYCEAWFMCEPDPILPGHLIRIQVHEVSMDGKVLVRYDPQGVEDLRERNRGRPQPYRCKDPAPADWEEWMKPTP